MNKINFFYFSMPFDSPITTIVGDDTPRPAKIHLVAGLILDGQPEEYTVEIITPDFPILNRQPVPRGKIITLGDSGYITTQLTMPLSINNAVRNQVYNITIKLFKKDKEVADAETSLYIVGESDVF
ncbi:hypothetical protein KQH98_09950 [Lactococcus lactis]|uniref:hypothetical protein n=1 Tax=Lactococcus lactis TaxID=1358 RepID=UPI001C126FDE|nr:hypothetical protein [Lactococcus lactis]MBU5243604.1 hypothetical protein [Lactococcus lactis]